MITIINPTRLTRQPFFKDLINYLDQHDDVILRQIKAQFPDQPVDKLMEEYIKAGFILRENKRYTLNLPFLKSADLVDLDQEVFVREDSAVYQELKAKVFQTELRNTTNEAILIEETDFARHAQTLSNYFYKVAPPISIDRGSRKALCYFGRCESQYALKYMTSFCSSSSKRRSPAKAQGHFVDS